MSFLRRVQSVLLVDRLNIRIMDDDDENMTALERVLPLCDGSALFSVHVSARDPGTLLGKFPRLAQCQFLIIEWTWMIDDAAARITEYLLKWLAEPREDGQPKLLFFWCIRRCHA